MKNLLTFVKFNENIETHGYGGVLPNDPTLSYNGYDKFKSDLLSQFTKLQAICQNIFNTGASTTLGSSKFDFDIKEFKIFRIFRNNNGFLDVYLKFNLDKNDYMGCFKDWGSTRCKFESSVLQIPEITYHLENKIKLEGLFKKVLNEWFIPSKGEYKTLKDVKVYDDMGDIFYIPSDSKVIINEVITENESPLLTILFKDRKYYLSNLDFYFFHWWFEIKPETKFYI